MLCIQLAPECSRRAKGILPIKQLLIGQEAVHPTNIDQSEAEDRGVRVGGKYAGDTGGEGHGEVTGDLHQAAGEREREKQALVTHLQHAHAHAHMHTYRLCSPPLKKALMYSVRAAATGQVSCAFREIGLGPRDTPEGISQMVAVCQACKTRLVALVSHVTLTGTVD